MKAFTVIGLFVGVVAFGLAFLTPGANAADQPWDAPAFSLDPPVLSQAVSAVSEPDEQDVIIFLDETHFSFETDGRRDYKHRLIFKVLSQKGAEDMSSINVDWEPWHESQPTVRARVIDPDLTVHELDPKTLTEAGSRSDQQDVYTDSKTLEGPLPAMMPGAIVEESFEVPETQPLFAGGIADRVSLDWDVPVEHSRVIIDSPDSLPVHAVVIGPVALRPEITKDGSRSIWTLKAERIAAEKDVPPFLPPDLARGTEVDFSTAASWQAVAAAYSQILDRQIVVEQAKPIAARALQGKKTRDEAMAALIAELHKEVRYTGVEFGQSSLVPETPSEVLQRKYGDCKDKASLLVAMLRSYGVQAYVALLSAGEGEDINPQMPGMGLFDHAIVYVPSVSPSSGSGARDLWIDATDEYARLGHFPGDDQGRWALIIRPDQTALVRTPENTSADNRTIETREFTLAEDGPARVVETSDSWGSIEAGYRSYFDGDTKKIHDELESYVKNTYLADKLTRLDSTPVGDFSVPFRIRLEADSASRGESERADAAVAITLSGLASRLPDYFTSKDDNKDKKANAVPRTDDFILPEPYVDEWHYHIIPPPGFASNPLPDGVDREIGPAKLTEQFQKNADGTVNATIRFDTGKRRMTAQEAEALRSGIIALDKEKAVMVTFNEIGEADLSAGKISEALAQFHALAAMHPKEALHHDQIARALLAGGMGELARAEAKKATELEPTSADAYSELGFVLEDDLIGRQFRKGFDLNGAIAAFQKAVELDPSSDRIRGNYAILLEHNQDGVRYGAGARLNDAIEQYRTAKDLASVGLGNNLPVALMWAKRFPELKQEVEKAAPSNAREGQLLVARAAMDGAAAAIAQAAADEPDSNTQRTVLLGAGGILMELRMYPQAADLLDAGAKGNQNAASLLAQVTTLRNAKPQEDLGLSDSNPRSVAERFLIQDRAEAASTENISSLFTEAARKYFSDTDSIALWRHGFDAYHILAAKISFPLDVASDIDLAGVQYSLEGTDATGYKIVLSGPATIEAATNVTLFVIKQDGGYKIVGVKGLMNSVIGDQIVRFVNAGNLTAASQWLDWVRDGAGSTSGDDPLASLSIVRMWKKGQGENDKDAIRYAAAGLMSGGRVFSKEAVPILLEGLARASSDQERLNLDKALADAYEIQDDFADELPVVRRLAKEAPDSETVAEMLQSSLAGSKQWDEAIQLAQDRMNKNSDDPREIRDYAWILWQAGKLEESQLVRKKLIDLGKATAGDYNQISWSYLLENRVTPEVVQEAEHATLLSGGRDGDIVDTQAAIYAEIGRASEAYTMELQAIDLEGDEEPDTGAWYVFGRIAEQYGERDAAIQDYKKCEAPEGPWAMSDSAYLLAQRRLKTIEQTSK